jgi:hypothetical protein
VAWGHPRHAIVLPYVRENMNPQLGQDIFLIEAKVFQLNPRSLMA